MRSCYISNYIVSDSHVIWFNTLGSFDISIQYFAHPKERSIEESIEDIEPDIMNPDPVNLHLVKPKYQK